MKKPIIQKKAKELWQAPTWYNALSLTERVAQERARPQDILTKYKAHIDTAMQRLSTWKAQPPFDQGTLFEERLASDSLTEEDFLALLTEAAAEVKVLTPSLPD